MQNISFYSWVRKGLGSQITEVDDLGEETSKVKKRPEVQLTAKLETVDCSVENVGPDTPEEKITKSVRYETKTINLSGPGDVVSLNANSIARVFPAPNFSGFPVNDFPYIEFWEPDFAWRFTPAQATGKKGEENRKLRPWLTLVVCKSSECSIQKSSWGTDIVTFNVDDSGYKKIFPLPADDVLKSAHVQVGDSGDEICRILGIKSLEKELKLEENYMDCGTEYRVFLIPVFEVGRLRGIFGPDYDEKKLDDIIVQKSAWEATLKEQIKKHLQSPLTFPSYYSWAFTTGTLSFAEKVRSLKRNESTSNGIDVDVTSLGEGLDYAVLGKKEGRRNEINVPAAMKSVKNLTKEVFPNPSNDEKDVYDNLNKLLSKSPVFEENARIINGNDKSPNVDEDDPVITPPIYGGKHILATSLNDSEAPWMNQVNLDLHYRAAAGLGKKAVQRNQEELVNRAWQQIDAVKAMNAELCRKMLGANVNDSVKYLNYKWAGSTSKKISTKNEESELISQMMMNLSSMKNTSFGKNNSGNDVSLASILKKKGIPEVFVSDSFRRTAEKTLENVSYPTLVQGIAEQQIYMMSGISMKNTLKKEDLENYANKQIIPYLGKKLIETTELANLFSWIGPQSNLNVLGFSGWSLSTFSIRSSRIKTFWKSSCYTDIKDSILRSRGKTEKDVIDFFVTNRLWEISTVGYTDYSAPDVAEQSRDTNIYALDSVVFRSLFFLNESDNITVVRVKTENKWIYIIDRDKIACDKVCFYRTALNGSCSKMEHPSKLLSDNDYFLKLKKNENVPWIDRTKWEICAYTFLYTPERVVATTTDLDSIVDSQNQEGEKYSFENASDLYKRLIVNYDAFVKDKKGVIDQNKRLYKAWNNLINCIDGIELTQEPQMPEYKGCIEDVTTLRNGLRDDSLYARLKECAATYYSTFFSSDKLIGDYLEDCLASKYPIKAYPIFPEPAYYYLKDIADEFILPGIETLPDDSISMFKGNAAFVESYLCGMNTEMGRELLWREYPTDQRGSYFKKFWDSATTEEDIKKSNFFDVKSLHRWAGNLGENHMVSENGQSKGDLLFFAIKSDLMKLYPDTKITLRKASCTYIKNQPLQFQIDTSSSKETIYPVAEGFVREGIYTVGFPITFEKALGTPPEVDKTSSCGYMLVFERAKENIEFVLRDKNVNDSASFAIECLDTTSLVGKHVLTLIGQN
ncbi:hypothetical protein [Fibrobacter sp. UWB11]|uniref:hypothetical protein n=1 Tax=Fibrobacter sp. UWB11 TaxID=1896202 RepID=UPI000928D834|nr:hypothetical protein [Fibrobacter sp. UWB11]SIN96314.1 hypothetical protein SAMN05720758_0776 [Fibrobacter sp. UWB11]